jgi:hypothetical protein
VYGTLGCDLFKKILLNVAFHTNRPYQAPLITAEGLRDWP